MMNESVERRTVLHDEHLALGARMVPFGGFSMPVQYEGILKEHEAVRKRAGLFDLSHMAQYFFTGAGVAEWLDGLTVNKVATMKPGQARYNIFTNEQGGAHDDVIVYRLDDLRWMVVVNAGNAVKMLGYLTPRVPAGVEFVSKHGGNANIAIQGPLSERLLAPVAGADVASMKYYACLECAVDGVPAIVARTGYTGEDGFEIFVEGEAAPRIWRKLLAAGTAEGVRPCGLGARDLLRLEAGMPLYGHELTEEITPIQAGLAWVVKFDKAAFPGKEMLRRQAEADQYARIVGVTSVEGPPIREGYVVKYEEMPMGEIRSGAPSPTVGANIGTALVAKAAAAPGTRVTVEIRAREYPAEVVALPFYKREK
ncbi:MAG TPA: glycine cleavage system aminomethyltransferase GcvT [Candidatus Dormibacteraeota bacterium]|nr:glycine cleavage system aminomethyltransferase GcvT [Candidatus Dormibacteraeota bacterium]